MAIDEVKQKRQSGPPIKVESNYYVIKIYFGDTLHLSLRRRGLVGIYAFFDDQDNHSVQYIYERGAKVHVEYESKALWKAVLAKIDEVLR